MAIYVEHLIFTCGLAYCMVTVASLVLLLQSK